MLVTKKIKVKNYLLKSLNVKNKKVGTGQFSKIILLNNNML